MVRDMDRMRYVAANYERLQGLLTAVIGLFLLGTGMLELVPWWAPGSIVPLLLDLAFFGALIALYLKAWSYYKRTIGQVRYNVVSRRDWLVGAAVLFYLAAIFVLPDRGQPVYWSQLLLGLMLFVLMWPERRHRAYYLVVAASIAASSFLPLLGILPEPTRDAIIYHNALDPARIVPRITVGLGLVIVGLLDHVLLIRSLPPASKHEASR